MKIRPIIFAAAASLTLLTACSANFEPSPLWAEASPETSALTFYVYNGTATHNCLLFDNEQINEILNMLSSEAVKPIENPDSDDISAPIYGIEISKKNGSPLKAAWTDNILILNDGTAYKFDYSSEIYSNWLENYSFEHFESWDSTTYFPCADYLLKNETGWNFPLMTESDAKIIAEDIYLEITSHENGNFKAKIINDTDYAFIYGTYFEIQTEHNGKWYELPTKSDVNYCFTDLAYELPPHTESQENPYYAESYGTLPDGKYRLVVTNLTADTIVTDLNSGVCAEFTVADNIISY